MKSYTSVGRGSWLRDSTRLVRGASKMKQHMADHVKEVMQSIRDAEQLVARLYGVKLEGLDMLEIGVGQLPRQMGPLALRNRVTGIDLDVIPRGFDLPGYFTMLRRNGPARVAKTLGRKLMGFDRELNRALLAELGVARFPDFRVGRMDATNMTFPDASFDFVYSFAVFEHLPQPRAVLAQIRRVLRPGGVSFTSLHPLTADDGFHDLRLIARQHEGIPYWAHLRPAQAHAVQCSAYINEIRLPEWRRIFEEEMPGAYVGTTPPPDIQVQIPELSRIRAGGELQDYTDEELLASRVISCWRKPGA